MKQLEKLQWYSLSYKLSPSHSFSFTVFLYALLCPSLPLFPGDDTWFSISTHTHTHTFGYTQDNLIQCVRLRHQIRRRAYDLVGLPVWTQAKLASLKSEEREVWIRNKIVIEGLQYKMMECWCWMLWSCEMRSDISNNRTNVIELEGITLGIGFYFLLIK